MKMKKTIGKIAPLGVSAWGKELQFAFVSASKECGVILYDVKSGKELERIPFPEEYRVGNVHTMCIQGITAKEFMYEFYEGDTVCSDSYARKFVGNEVYGEIAGVQNKKAVFASRDYDWEGDKKPGVPYEQSIVYGMHVRGFTKHASSKVKNKGTFKGVEEKIPYLKELGITTIELQPIYEFDEVYVKGNNREESKFFKMPDAQSEVKKEQLGINYWGYTKGYYYAPKSSYASGDSVNELKDLIKSLHKNGIEVILQFYFPSEVGAWEVLDILRYWVLEYHVDGFHIKGQCTPMDLICGDPVLKDVKLWYYDFSKPGNEVTENRKYGIYNDDFASVMRRFVKGDEDMVGTALEYMRMQPSHAGKINYVSNYNGFTLMDVVSYERKHNEANGEENKDGTDYNFSWNCGMEGPAKKKWLSKLRVQQIKNFMTLLVLSQGTPMIFMGDEFGNSQEGNNNPYCQDNEISWLDWKDLEKNVELYEFFKELISLRKAHPVLRQEKQLRLMDYISSGYPDLSYHGEEPWKPMMERYSHQIGIMLCGKYARIDRQTEDNSFYIGINMHWEEHSYALPKLPRGEQWELCLCTEKDKNIVIDENRCITISPRSVCVFQSSKGGKK